MSNDFDKARRLAGRFQLVAEDGHNVGRGFFETHIWFAGHSWGLWAAHADLCVGQYTLSMEGDGDSPANALRSVADKLEPLWLREAAKAEEEGDDAPADTDE